jgi:N-acylglucosamine 2-epimerase
MLAPTVPIVVSPPLERYAELYRNELINNILPFWLTHSRDTRNGGYFTCLDREGKVYDTDKFIWLQGRQVWCFATMYKHLEKREQWLDMALHGASFLNKYGQDANGDWYFSLTAEGKPLVQPYNIFSDCFATMAFASLATLQPNAEWGDVALNTFHNILKRKDNWKGQYNKAYPGTRPLRNFSLPMILCNLALELEPLIGTKRTNEFLPGIIAEVMDVFYQPEFGLVLENVNPDGTFNDSFEGRLLNPGHGIEAMWFLMDLGVRMEDKALIEKAKDIVLDTLEYAWDKDFGGIYYFMDVKGHPTQQLEWDQKLWWVHVETLVALAKGFTLTGDMRCAEWFEKVHHYTWEHFKDPEYPEWFGYLNRRGEVLLPLKGGKWKGCFHVPRALFQIQKTLAAPTPII